jgi:hypothetical protein
MLKAVFGATATITVTLACAGVALAAPSVCGFQVCYDEALPGGGNASGTTGVQGSGPHAAAGTRNAADAGGGSVNTRGGASNGGAAGGCAAAGTSDGNNTGSASGQAGTLGFTYVIGSAGVVADGTPAGAVVGVTPPPGLPFAGPAAPPACSR